MKSRNIWNYRFRPSSAGLELRVKYKGVIMNLLTDNYDYHKWKE